MTGYCVQALNSQGLDSEKEPQRERERAEEEDEGRKRRRGQGVRAVAVALACCQRHYPPMPTYPPARPPATSHTSHVVTHFFFDSEHLGLALPHTACSLLLRVWASVCVCVLQQTLRRPSTESSRTVLPPNSHQAQPINSLLHLSQIYVSVLQSFSSHAHVFVSYCTN